MSTTQAVSVALVGDVILQTALEALLDTLAACDGADVRRCGAGATLEEALAPAWLEARGRRLALLSVSCTLPPGCEATETDPGIAPLRVAMSFEIDPNLLAEQPGTMPIAHTWARPEDQELVC